MATMDLAPSVTFLAENDRATSERGWVSLNGGLIAIRARAKRARGGGGIDPLLAVSLRVAPEPTWPYPLMQTI